MPYLLWSADICITKIANTTRNKIVGVDYGPVVYLNRTKAGLRDKNMAYKKFSCIQTKEWWLCFWRVSCFLVRCYCRIYSFWFIIQRWIDLQTNNLKNLILSNLFSLAYNSTMNRKLDSLTKLIFSWQDAWTSPIAILDGYSSQRHCKNSKRIPRNPLFDDGRTTL